MGNNNTSIRTSGNLRLGIFLSYISLFVGIVCSFIYSHYATSILSTNQYGLFTTGTALMGYLSLLTFGLSGTVIRFASQYITKGQKKEESALYGFFLLVFLAVAVVVFLLGSLIIVFEPHIFKTSGSSEDHQLRLIILFMLINLCVSFPCSVFNSIICSYERFVFLKIVNIFVSISTPLTIVPLLFLGKQAVEVTLALQIIHILASISYVLYSLVRLKIKVSFNLKILDKQVFKDIFAYSAFIFIGSLCDQLYWSTDKFILSIFVSQTAVAIYGVGAMFHSYFQQFSGSISEVLFPRIAKDISVNKDKKYLNDVFIKTGRILTFLLLLILSGFVIFGKEFIFYLTRKAEYNDAYYIALLVLVPATIPLTQSTAFLIIKALGKHKFRAILYLIIAVINALVSIPLGIKFGGIGCALATCICAFIGHGLIMNIYYKRKIGLDISLFWKEFFRILIPVFFYSLFFFFIIEKIGSHGIVVFLCEILVYSVGYCFMSYFFLFNTFEKNNVLNILKKMKRKQEYFDVQILVTTMNKNFDQMIELYKTMNIFTNCIIRSQCGLCDNKVVKINGFTVQLVLADDKGLSKNRNELLKLSSSKFIIFADDDEIFDNNFRNSLVLPRRILDKAIALTVPVKRGNKLFYIKKAVKKIRLQNFSTGIWCFILNKEYLDRNLIIFNERFGSGAEINHGEDSIFIQELFKNGNIYCLKARYPLISFSNDRKSTWFKGVTPEFVKSRATLIGYLHPHLYKVYLLKMFYQYKLWKHDILIKKLIYYARDGLHIRRQSELRNNH